MQFIVEFGTLILTSYLALTNALAGYLLPQEVAVTTTVESNTSSLTQLDSSYQFIPDILLTNPAFQQANVAGSIQSDDNISTHSVTDATVNIFCTYTTETAIKTTTGSGFFINARGAILTNAHVAQFLLLEQSSREGETDCVIRSGSPAVAQYEAELLYIPPAWISEHADMISVETPTGTGERDFALLYASASLTDTPMPARFPYLSVGTHSFDYDNRGDIVTAAGYPADPLYADGIDAPLPLVTATTNITDLYTFASENADLLSVAESPVSAGGSSGGPIVNEAGQAIGVIVTRGETREDSLRALTLNYIDRTIAEETGFSLLSYIQSDLSVRAAVFNQALAPFLLKLLEIELEE